MPVRTFVPSTKVQKKPNIPHYDPIPKTLGAHIRKKRIEGKLSQAHAAIALGVDENTVTGWELERNHPLIKYYPAIIAFLGYYPFDHETDTYAGKLKQIRYCKGLSFERCAVLLSISTDAAMRWERGKPIANKMYKERIHSVWNGLPNHLLQHPA